MNDIVWLRVLDTSGSWHPCAKGDPGATAFVKAALPSGYEGLVDELNEAADLEDNTVGVQQDYYHAELLRKAAEAIAALGRVRSEAVEHHPLCSIHSGKPCDYDCARDYPQPGFLRERIAAAIADMPRDKFVAWKENHSTYPNSYKSSVDRVYAIADRVITALQTLQGRMTMDSTKALETICRTLAPYGHRDRDLERIAGEIVDDLRDEGFALTALAAQGEAAQPAEEGWRDISSAPKDRLLLLAAEFLGKGDWRIKIGGWREDWGRWEIFGASWQPTHWMPLPASPNAASQDGGTDQ